MKSETEPTGCTLSSCVSTVGASPKRLSDIKQWMDVNSRGLQTSFALLQHWRTMYNAMGPTCSSAGPEGIASKLL
jgi:hypothetical protein